MNKIRFILLMVAIGGLFFCEKARAVEAPEIHFSKGVVAFVEKDYRRAAEEFEEVVKLRPTDSKAYFYLGSCYFNLKDYPQAKSSLSKAATLDPELKTATKLLIDEMEGKPVERRIPAKKRWAISGKFGAEYDDNVVLNPSGVTTAISDQEDWRVILNLNLEYQPIREPLELATYYNFYQSRHGELTDYNLQGHTIGLYTSAKREPWKFRLQYSYDYYWLALARDDYLAVHTIIPTANLTLRKNKLTQFYYQFREKDYFQSTAGSTNQDAGNNMPGINQYLFFKNRSSLKLGYAYEDNDARGGNWDYLGHYILLAYNYPLTENLKLKLGFNYYPTRYKNVDTIYNQKREDDERSYSLSLSRKLNKSLNLSFAYTYVDNDSNIAEYTYSRNIYSLVTEFKF